MIIGKIAKAVLKLIMPDMVEHLMKVFKLEKLVNYMELPNSADRRLDVLEEKFDVMIGEIKDLQEVIKKIKNKKAFKLG